MSGRKTRLVDGAEPLRLADGRIVMPGGHVRTPHMTPADDAPADKPMYEVPTQKEAAQIVTKVRRRLSELPDVPRNMNAISVVLTYTLFGVEDFEIAVALGVPEDQVSRIKKLEAYATMHDTVVRSILDAETDTVRDMFFQNSRRAARVLVEALEDGSRPERMAAAKDLLDRAGHRPADVVEHRHRMDGGLIVEVIRKDERDRLPTIDVTDVKEQVDDDQV